MYFKKSFLWCIVLAVIVHFESTGSYAVNILLTANQYFGGNVAPILTCSPSDSNCDNPMWFFEETLLSTCECADKYQATSNPFNKRSTLRINNAGPEDTGMYHCEFDCSGETFASNMFKITYVAPVSFTTPDSISYYEYINNTVNLKCSPVDYDNHQWQTTGLVPIEIGGRFGLTGANNTDLIITELQLDDARTYVCTANNKVTTKAEIRAHLFVYKFPEVEVTGNTSVTAGEGNSTSFTCTVSGHPKPVVSWIFSGGSLSFGDRIVKNEDSLDDYTLQSTLTINHLTDNDEGDYICTAKNDNGTSSSTFKLSVTVPPVPYLSIFSTSVDQTSANISWILSGVPEDTIVNITWTTVNGIFNQLFNQDSSSFLISELSSNTSYLIIAEVINNVELVDSTEVVTDPSPPSESLSTSRIQSSTISTLFTTVVYTSQTASSSSSSSSLSTSPTSRPQRTSLSKAISRSTSVLVRPEPSVLEGQPSSETGPGVIIAGVVGSIIVIIVLGVVVILMICVINKRGEHNKQKNLRGIDRGSARSNQILLTYACEPTSTSKLYAHRNNGNSLSSLPPDFPLLSRNSSLPPHSQSSNDFTSFHKVPSHMEFSGLSQNESIHAFTSSGSCLTCPPPYNGDTGFKTFVVEPTDSGFETFEMTENPGNEQYEREQALGIRYANGLPPPMMRTVSDDVPFYLGGDSVSQIHNSAYSSLSQNTHENFTSQPEMEEAFEYQQNEVYETCPPQALRGKISSKGENSSLRSLDVPPPYENFSRQDLPKFGIIQNGRRGDVREQVELIRPN